MDARAIGALLGDGPSHWGITVKSDDQVLLWNMHKTDGPLDTSVCDGLSRREPVLHTNMDAWRRIQPDVTARHWVEVAQAAAAEKVPGLTVRWHAGLTHAHNLPSGTWVRFGEQSVLRLTKDAELVEVPMPDRYAAQVPEDWTVSSTEQEGWVVVP